MFNFFAPEHYHPLIVHFPIALWSFGALCYMLSGLGFLRWLETTAIVAGLVGTLFGWLATETGEKAAEIVGPALCRPQLLAEHGQELETAFVFFAVSFGLAAVAFVLKNRYLPRLAGAWWIKAFLSVGLILGMIFLVTGGHKGFQLVYEQGASVKTPSTKCFSTPPAAAEGVKK